MAVATQEGMTRTNALLSAVLIATLAACGRDPAIPGDARNLSMEQVGYDQSYQSSQFTEQTRLVIRDQQAWDDAWAKINGQTTAPATDFSTSMIVLAAMGQRNHGGYSIAFNDIAATRDALYVSVTESSPGSMCVTTQALVEPVVLARVERIDGDVQFIEHTQTTSCF